MFLHHFLLFVPSCGEEGEYHIPPPYLALPKSGNFLLARGLPGFPGVLASFLLVAAGGLLSSGEMISCRAGPEAYRLVLPMSTIGGGTGRWGSGGSLLALLMPSKDEIRCTEMCFKRIA